MSGMPAKMHIARKADVWHLVRQGRILQPHIDTETNSLHNPLILEYGRAGGDMAGNFTGSTQVSVKRPDEYLGDPRAFIVTRTDPTETQEPGRDYFPNAMGKIAWEYQNAIEMMDRLPLESKTVVFDSVRKRGKELVRKGEVEEIKEYPLLGEDGQVVNDVRYHPGKGKFSYRVDEDPASPYYEQVSNNYYEDSDGSKWKFMDIHLQTGGWNVKRADMSWLRLNFERAGFHSSNLFFYYSRGTVTNKQLQKGYVVDGARATLVVHAFDRKDENSIQIGTRRHPETGEMIPSLKLGLVMQANTRYADPQIGVEEGVRMPDGSIHTEAKAHRYVTYDAEASYAMYSHLRRRAPQLLKQVELQADDQELRRMLNGGDDPERPPIYGMVRRGYPMTYPLADAVTPLLPDDQASDMRYVPVLRLDKDLATYCYRNKTLAEMTAPEIATMIQEQPRAEALIRLEPIRHWSGLVPLDDSLPGIYEGGDNERTDMFFKINASFRFTVENDDVMEKIYDAVSLVEARMSHRAEPVNPLMEEQGVRNLFGDLDYWEERAKSDAARRRTNGDGGAMPSVAEMIYNRATDIYNHLNKTDAMLHSLAVQPLPVDWSGEEWALDNFHDMLKRVQTKLNKKIYTRQEVSFVTEEGEPVPVVVPSPARAGMEYKATVTSPVITQMYREGRLADPSAADKALIKEIVANVRAQVFDMHLDAQAEGEGAEKIRSAALEGEHGGKAYTAEIRAELLPSSAYRRAVDGDEWARSFLKNYKEDKKAADWDPQETAEEARAFRWRLARQLLDDDYAARAEPKSAYARNCFDAECMNEGKLLFANPSRDFRVIDRAGREIDMEYMLEQHAQHPREVISKFDTGEWDIQFHRLSSVTSVAATLQRFAFMEKLDELPKHWQKEYELHRGYRLYGPPNVDPDEHRWPTIPQIKRVIQRIEVNAKAGNREELARVFGDFTGLSRGEADVFMQHDESWRILESVRKMVEETEKKYPFREEFNRAANFDPETGLPYEWVQHEIPRKNVVVIDVPDTHLRRPLDDMTVGSPYSLVVKVTREQEKKAAQGAEIVLRGTQTGQLFYGGPAEIRAAPEEKDGYQDYYRAADKAYRDAGEAPVPRGKARILVVEKPKPIAWSRRNIDPGIQAVRVPGVYFTGLVAPQLSYLPQDRPLTGLVMPADYCTQKLEVGKAVRFCETDAPMGSKLEGQDGDVTGHTYESTLRGAVRMTVGQVKEWGDNEAAVRCGFANCHEMWEQLTTAFRGQESPDPQAEEVVVMRFDKVRKTSWAFWNPSRRVDAAFTYGNKPVPPTALRPVRRAA